MNCSAAEPLRQISVAHSPDSDDIVQFLAITSGAVDTGRYRFKFTRLDTAELNRCAAAGDFDVVAISTAAYPQAASRYLILPHGASIGRSYGPVLAAKKKFELSELNSLKIGIPGATTTAAALLRLIAPQAATVTVPISPFEKIFSALEDGSIDAALLIHEGQIVFDKFGLIPLLNLGVWWQERYHSPLALGLNLIKRGLGMEQIGAISEILRRSIRKGVLERDWAIETFLAAEPPSRSPLSPEQLRRYLEMYANEDTLDLDRDCKAGIKTLITSIDPACPVEFAP